MLSNLELKNFRGIEHARFENLGRANLIVGGNNAGKTSVLEALVLLNGNKQQLSELPSKFRELPNGDSDSIPAFWMMLPRSPFRGGFLLQSDSVSVALSIDSNVWQLSRGKSGTMDGMVTIRGNSKLIIGDIATYYPTSILPTRLADPAKVSDWFNQIAPLNPENESRIEDLLRKSIEPRLRRLRYAKPQNLKNHMVYADVGEGTMFPYTQLGQAFTRTLEIYCELFANQPKILLIDEIENGLYYEGLVDFWKGLFEAIEAQDVQLFATTHSRECMEAAHRAAIERDSYPLRYLRLDRRVDDPSQIVATTFAKEEMQTAIESHLEMR